MHDTSDRPHSFDPSPLRMRVDSTTLLVVDMQQRLLGVQLDGERVTWNIRRLLAAAAALGLPAYATEQVPAKLGPTLPDLARRATHIYPKTAFSAAGDPALAARLTEENRHAVLLCGIETHVCVGQTALDLVAAGISVYLPVDAVTSRFAIDRDIALRRLEASGVILTTTEAAMFELCADATHPAFRTLSALAKETFPQPDNCSSLAEGST